MSDNIDQRAIDNAAAAFRLVLHGAASAPIIEEGESVGVSRNRLGWMLATLLASAGQSMEDVDFSEFLADVASQTVTIRSRSRFGKTVKLDCRKAAQT